MFHAFKFLLLGVMLGALPLYFTEMALAGKIVLFWLGGVFLYMSCCYTWLGVTGRQPKNPFWHRENGEMNPLALLLAGPYQCMNLAVLSLFRIMIREPAMSCVAERVHVSGRLMPFDRREFESAGIDAVVNLAAEFWEVPYARSPHADYLFLPVLDLTGPTPDQLEKGVRWSRERYDAGKDILIHCALGHGRSATLCAAFLMDMNPGQTIDEVVSAMKHVRPRINIRPQQRKAIKRFLERKRT